jgi:hypothetical protein
MCRIGTNKPTANRLAVMHRLIANDPGNAERIRPYLGGAEVNDSPTHAHHRYVINFADVPLRREDVGLAWTDANEEQRAACPREGIVPPDYPSPVAADWPDLLEIVEERVRPERLAAALGGHSSDANRWPDDKRFRTSWIGNQFYGGYRRSRVLMILQAIEAFHLREGTKGEPIVTFDFSALEIEHILPRKWEQHWPSPGDDKACEERDRRLHGIGNLTLVTGKLNPTLSNAHWLDGSNEMKGKRTTFDHSKLQMNARPVKAWPDDWNEATIDVRASQLFETACQVWPPPPVPR